MIGELTTMSKYVDIDHEIQEMQQVIDEHKNSHTFENEIASHAFKLMIEKFQSLPPADVAPVIHAHWIDCNGKPVESDSNGCPKDSCWCSHCHEWLVASDEYMVIGKYCPNCGAKMDEEGEENEQIH